MSILSNATKHFKKKIEGKKLKIEVPEWGTDKEKCVLYMRPLDCCSVQKASKIYRLMQDATLESMVDIIVMLATNSPNDTGDKYVFSGPVDRDQLLRKVDHTIVTRIFNEWASATQEPEDAKK